MRETAKPRHWLTDGPIERIQFDKGMVNLQERVCIFRQDVGDYGCRHENKKECQEDDAIAIFRGPASNQPRGVRLRWHLSGVRVRFISLEFQ